MKQSIHPKLPERITIICRANNTLVSGVLVILTLKVSRKNDFHVLSTPTFNGITAIRASRICEEIRRDIALFPMDYAGIEAITGEILVSLMDREQITAALEAYNLLHDDSAYPQGYAEKLTKAMSVLDTLGSKRLSLIAFAEGEGGENIRLSVEDKTLVLV